MRANVSPTELAMLEQRRDGLPGPKVRRAAPTRKEREILAACLEYLNLVPGVVAWRNNRGMAMLPGRDGKPMPVRFGGIKGASDIIGWQSVRLAVQITGAAPFARFLAVEVKAEGRYPTTDQQIFLESVIAAGGIGLIARSVDDVRRGLGL